VIFSTATRKFITGQLAAKSWVVNSSILLRRRDISDLDFHGLTPFMLVDELSTTLEVQDLPFVHLVSNARSLAPKIDEQVFEGHVN
jgi:hypothetical protein